jgi:hypothetical protein
MSLAGLRVLLWRKTRYAKQGGIVMAVRKRKKAAKKTAKKKTHKKATRRKTTARRRKHRKTARASAGHQAEQQA